MGPQLISVLGAFSWMFSGVHDLLGFITRPCWPTLSYIKEIPDYHRFFSVTHLLSFMIWVSWVRWLNNCELILFCLLQYLLLTLAASSGRVTATSMASWVRFQIAYLLFKVIIIMIFYIYLLILLDDSVYAHLNSSVYMCIYIGIYICMYICGVVYTSIWTYVYICIHMGVCVYIWR